MKRTPIVAVTTLLLSFLFSTGIAGAQAPAAAPLAAAQPAVSQPPAAPAPAADSRPADSDFRKGAYYWRFGFGASLPIEYKDSEADRRIWVAPLEVGRIMTRRHGPGPLAGQFEMMFQAQPTVVRGTTHWPGIGLMPVSLRWNFAGGRQVRPFAEAGAGLMLIKWPYPGPGRVALNFYQQIGFGVRIGRPTKIGLIAGFRYQHISNGGRAKPSYGTDGYIVYGGVSILQQFAAPADPSSTARQVAPDAAARPAPRRSAEGLSFGGGTGLIRTVTPDTLDPGNWAVSALEMNYDRNPGDIDVVKIGFQFAVGVTKRAEVFVGYTPVLRTNAVNLDPLAYPVPPLELFVDTYPTVADRAEPYFLFMQEVPYKTYDSTVRVVPPSWGAFSQSSGDVTFGGKVNLLSERRGEPLGLAVHASVSIPTEEPEGNTANWAKLAGVPGGVNVGVQVAVAKAFKKTQLVGNLGYTFVGDPALGGTRIQYVDSSRAGTPGFLVGQPKTLTLDLHDQLSLSGGVRVPVFKLGPAQAWVIGEVNYIRYVGRGTPVERVIHIPEMCLGLQGEVPGYRNLIVGAAWQRPLIDMGNGDVRTTNLSTPDGRGDVNFGQLVDPALASTVSAYFAQNGVTLAANTSKVFATNNAAFDPWRNVPTEPRNVVAEGNNAIVAFITWRFR